LHSCSKDLVKCVSVFIVDTIKIFFQREIEKKEERKIYFSRESEIGRHK